MKMSDDHQWLHVGSQRWLVHVYRHEDIDLPDTSVQVMRTRQALVMLESGWYVSVIWGTYTHSSNNWLWNMRNPPEFSEDPVEVEVGLRWRDDPELIPLEGDTVTSYVTADELNFLLNWLARHGEAELEAFLPTWREARKCHE